MVDNNCSLRIEKEDDEEMSGQSAALVFYDELVRGDNFLCKLLFSVLVPTVQFLSL